MISLHEIFSGSGVVESYAYALLSGAVTAVVAIALSVRLTSTDRSVIAA